MSNDDARSDIEVLRLALKDVTGVAYGTTADDVEEMMLGLRGLVANGSRADLVNLASSIATFLGQPSALCDPPNTRFRKLSTTFKASVVTSGP